MLQLEEIPSLMKQPGVYDLAIFYYKWRRDMYEKPVYNELLRYHSMGIPLHPKAFNQTIFIRSLISPSFSVGLEILTSLTKAL